MTIAENISITKISLGLSMHALIRLGKTHGGSVVAMARDQSVSIFRVA
jgi:hypothetical protein